MHLGNVTQLDDSIQKAAEWCGMIGVGGLGSIACVITGSRRASECRGQGTGMENRTGTEIELYTSALLCFSFVCIQLELAECAASVPTEIV